MSTHSTPASPIAKASGIQWPHPKSSDPPDDVLFNTLYGVRTIELNRPGKLNSLNASMVRKIIPRIREWENSQLANVIIISGIGPKAFCAGGDVADLAEQNKTGPEGVNKSKGYFALEYQLDHLLATSSMPIVAYLDGITMGGGVGLSVHLPIRIATERTVFAMPETTIGFFPDVGGSFFLPRMDGHVGTYLALTSERLHGVQAYYAGIATHYIPSSTLSLLSRRLAELTFPDHLPLEARLSLINSTILEFSSGVPQDAPPLLAGPLRIAIDAVFSQPTIPAMLSTLSTLSEDPTLSSKLPIPPTHQQEISSWATKTRTTLLQRSPTSLAITLKQLRFGANWSISETFQREYELASKFMTSHDFNEGVTARLLEKRAPTWSPPSIDDIPPNSIIEYFKIPEGKPKLPLLRPDALRSQKINYMNYPHTWLGLPRERLVEDVVRKGGLTQEDVVRTVAGRWTAGDRGGFGGLKPVVEQKVLDVVARKCVDREGTGRLSWVN
ncbi:MAG: hypothetical protein M1834_009364 [Cirrosporium novae-zelandiae]|nr:MAG: hypothetical protein M1834_009364 [Cirrosporium novae-zelandiae]